MTPPGSLKYLGEARWLKGGKLQARLDYVAEKCSLKGVWGKAISKLSRGFRQRVGMAQVLLHEPDVLIMDEPTSGLDPNQIRQVRRTIREMAANRTILLSTHILQEVEAVADRVILICRGRIVYDGAPRDMQGQHATLDDAFQAYTEGEGCGPTGM